MSDLLNQTQKQINPECAFTFNAILDRIHKIEKYSIEKQSEEISEIGKTLVRFEVLIEKQNDTNALIMREFMESRKENMEQHKERDAIVQKLSENILDISHSLIDVTKTQNDIVTKIDSLKDNQNKAIDAQNKKIDDINQRDNISVTATLKQVLMQALIALLTTGIAIQFIKK